jgi:peptidoglycan/LPS O-acetylase OafA/YrhL
MAGMANWHSIALADAGEGFRLLGPLGVYWSLSLEEQFYIIMFGLLVFSLRRGEARIRWFVGLLVGVWVVSVCSMWLVDSTPQRDLFGTDTRASEAVVGCLLAVWVHHRGMPTNRLAKNLGWISLAAGLGFWLFVHETDPWSRIWGLPLFAFISAGMIVGLSQESRTARAFSTRPMVLVGRISYPAYIIHWPVALALTPDRLHMTGFPLIAVRFAVALGIAWLMFEYLEKPFKDLKAVRFPNGLVLWAGLGFAATATTVAVAGWGWP